METKNTILAAERLFRVYYKHCVNPDQDTLFEFLNAAHSLNDKLRSETGKDFFGIDEFIALKALRNMYHHNSDLSHEIRIASVAGLTDIFTDLAHMCIVPVEQIEKAISLVDQRHRQAQENAIRKTVKWFGSVANINPCIFNFVVHVYEKLRNLGITLAGAEYLEFKRSYIFEEQNEYSHFVTGEISCRAGDIEKVLENLFSKVE